MALRRMTIRNGRPASGNGGNILVTTSTLLLVDVRVTNGQAVSGGGIYVQSTGTSGMLIASGSLIDHNAATGTGTGSPNPGGGGLYLEGSTASAFATLTNTTVAFNTAFRGGAVMGASGSALTLNGATIAYNQATNPADYGGLENACGDDRRIDHRRQHGACRRRARPGPEQLRDGPRRQRPGRQRRGPEPVQARRRSSRTTTQPAARHGTRRVPAATDAGHP